MKPKQYLTAKFKLRPSRRKAAILERARAAAEVAFWSHLEEIEHAAQDVLGIETKKDRKNAIKALCHPRLLAKYGMCSAVTDGVSRDLVATVRSYVELKLTPEFEKTEWPTPTVQQERRYDAGLDALAASIILEDESAARDEIYRGGQSRKYRPFVLSRGRECRLLRKTDTGAIVACLSVMRADDVKARKVHIAEGIDAATGEVIPAKKSVGVIIVPLEMGKWHENKFLSGQAILRSCEISREGDEWFMCAQFEMALPGQIETGGVLGIDRGMKVAVAGAAVDQDGRVKRLVATAGNDMARAMKRSEKRNKAYQRRKGTPRKGHKDTVKQILHTLANEIVAEAKSGRYAVAVENLNGFKSTVTQKRKAGARKGGWRKILKRMQLSELERILGYKLILAGLPPLMDVVAAGSSQTCTACGHRDKSNRQTQERFSCTSCGFETNADANAAGNIARRGVMQVTKQIKKGVKIDVLAKNMAENLGDGGLGPLAACAADGLVAARDTGEMVNEAIAPLPRAGSKKSARSGKKRALHVFTECAAYQSSYDFKDLSTDQWRWVRL